MITTPVQTHGRASLWLIPMRLCGLSPNVKTHGRASLWLIPNH